MEKVIYGLGGREAGFLRQVGDEIDIEITDSTRLPLNAQRGLDHLRERLKERFLVLLDGSGVFNFSGVPLNDELAQYIGDSLYFFTDGNLSMDRALQEACFSEYCDLLTDPEEDPSQEDDEGSGEWDDWIE